MNVVRRTARLAAEHGIITRNPATHDSLLHVDFHNHLMPGVDDGAQDDDESRAALERLHADGVEAVVVTPHLQGSLTTTPEKLARRLRELDEGWDRFREIAAGAFPEMRIERGTEVMLDAPKLDLSDPRIRLAGTSFVLVEFPYMTVPPNSAPAIFDLKMKGWTPIIAHPERYSGLDRRLEDVAEWRRVGGLLQVNSGSLLGRYGAQAQTIAWRLLRRGWVDFVASDYHARGRTSLAAAREKLEEMDAGEQYRLMTRVNPARILDGHHPEPVPPLQEPKKPWWKVF